MRLASEFGWTFPEIDRLPMRDVNDIIETFNERDGVSRASDEPVVPEEITEHEWQQMTAKYRAAADSTRNRSPFT